MMPRNGRKVRCPNWDKRFCYTALGTGGSELKSTATDCATSITNHGLTMFSPNKQRIPDTQQRGQIHLSLNHILLVAFRLDVISVSCRSRPKSRVSGSLPFSLSAHVHTIPSTSSHTLTDGSRDIPMRLSIMGNSILFELTPSRDGHPPDPTVTLPLPYAETRA